MEEKEFLEDGKTPNPKFVKKEDANGGKSGDGKDGEGKTTFTQEDLNRIAAKTRDEEKAKTDKAIADAVKTALEEEKRQAKLSEEQREAELRQKRDKEVEERDRNITLRENRITAVEKLVEKKLSPKLADLIVDLDLEKQETKLTQLTEAFSESVAAGVAEATKGKPPIDPKGGNSNNATGVPSSTF